jgi:hypothetical protein
MDEYQLLVEISYNSSLFEDGTAFVNTLHAPSEGDCDFSFLWRS